MSNYYNHVNINEIAKNWVSILSLYEADDKEAIAHTARRVSSALNFLLEGYDQNPDDYLKEFDFVDSNDLVIVKNIPFFSLCKHHILPFFGKAHVGYLPNQKVVGLSKIPRVVSIYSKRLQLQERLGRQICDALYSSTIKPRGVIVVLEAQHMCMQMRGIQSVGSVTTTASLAGDFENNHDLKLEFYKLMEG